MKCEVQYKVQWFRCVPGCNESGEISGFFDTEREAWEWIDEHGADYFASMWVVRPII